MMLSRLRSVQDSAFLLSDETLAMFRLLFFGMALVAWAPGTLLWVADYPEWLRTPPPGLPRLATRVPPLIVLHAIDVGIGLSALFGFLGVRTRIAGISLALLTLVHHSFVFSFGKIDHDFLQVAAVFVLSFSGWGNRFTIAELIRGNYRQPSESLTRNSQAVSILYAVIAVAFFSAGFAKLRGGWLDPGSQMARNWVVFYDNIAEPRPVLADLSLGLPVWIWELADIATVGLELGLVALLLLPRLMRLGVVLLIPFHLGVLVTMGIDFHGYLYLYLPLLAHTNAGHGFARWWDRQGWRAPLIALVVVGVYRISVTTLLPIAGGGDSRPYLSNLILFGVALVIVRWFVRGPARDRAVVRAPLPTPS